MEKDIKIDLQKPERLKLRLLDGTQALIGGMGYLAGLTTVKECFENPFMEEFIDDFMHFEVVPTLQADHKTSSGFVKGIIEHIKKFYGNYELIKATYDYSQKMNTGNIQTVENYYQKYHEVPKYFCLGFAAYLLFMKCELGSDSQFYGKIENEKYLVHDPLAKDFSFLWLKADINTVNSTENFVNTVLQTQTMWKCLQNITGFNQLLAQNLFQMYHHGVSETLESFIDMND
jgi:tagaturonate reductase